MKRLLLFFVSGILSLSASAFYDSFYNQYSMPLAVACITTNDYYGDWYYATPHIFLVPDYSYQSDYEFCMWDIRSSLLSNYIPGTYPVGTEFEYNGQWYKVLAVKPAPLWKTDGTIYDPDNEEDPISGTSTNEWNYYDWKNLLCNGNVSVEYSYDPWSYTPTYYIRHGFEWSWDLSINIHILPGFGEACYQYVTWANSFGSYDYNYSAVGYSNELTYDCYEKMFKDMTYCEVEGVENLSWENPYESRPATSLKQTFMNCKMSEKVDLGDITVSSLEETFSKVGTPAISSDLIKEVDLSHIKTDNLTSLKGTFKNCEKLTTVKTPASTTSFSNVTDMSAMFYGCVNLRNIDVSYWNTSNVKDIRDMFNHCRMLESLNTSNWDLRKLEKASYAFNECWRLKSLTFGPNFKLSYLSASNVTNMFSDMYACRYIDFFASNDVNAITASNFESLFGAPEYSSAKVSELPFSTKGNHTVVYLPHGSDAITDKMNVVYSYNKDQNDLRCHTYSCEFHDVNHVTTTAGVYYWRAQYHGLEFPRTFKTNAAYYHYQYDSSREYGSAILPYEFVTNDDAQAFTLHHEVPKKMYLEYSDRVPAHTPFIYQNKGGSNRTTHLNTIDETNNFGVTVYATHTTAQREGGSPYLTTAANNTSIDPSFDIWSAKGFYVTDTLWYNPNPTSDLIHYPCYTAPGQVYYIKNDKFVKAVGEHLVIKRNMALFYGYWTMGIDAVAGEAKEYSFEFGNPNGEVTGIDGLSVSEAVDKARTREDDENIVAIYDISGHRLKSVQKGVNILRMKDGTTRKLIKE